MDEHPEPGAIARAIQEIGKAGQGFSSQSSVFSLQAAVTRNL
jgi:hypothetical protein